MDQNALLRSISPLNERALISDLLKDDQDSWSEFLDENADELDEWANAAPWRLHFSGYPRCGKTTLAATIAEHVRRKQSHQTSVVTLFLGHLGVQPPAGDSTYSPQQLPKEILRSIARQLVQDLSSKAKRASIAQFAQHGKHSADGLTSEVLEDWIRSAVSCFNKVYIIIDDLDACSGLDEEAFMHSLQRLGVSSGLFVGMPLLRLWSKAYVCDFPECDEEDGPWAECETCNVCFCDRCYREGIRCDCGRISRPSLVKEIEIQCPSLESYVERKLTDAFPEEEMRQKVVDAVEDESSGCFALAKLSVDQVLETGDVGEVKKERVRLPLQYIRYFNMAFHRIKQQGCEADVRLAQAILSLVSSAGAEGSEFAISFDHLKGALAMLDTDQEFGEPLDRARVARVTQGWLCLGEQTSNGPYALSFFCEAARNFISDEAANSSDKNASGFKEFMVVCLNAITSPASQKLFSSLDDDPGKARQQLAKWPFIEHALRHWGRYALDGPSVQTRQLIRNFLRINFHSAPKLQYLAMLVGDGVRSASSDRLHIIARYGLTDLIEDGVQAGSAIDVACTVSGQTAAMVASRFCHLLFMEKLKENGADLAISCHNGQTALSIAVDHGYVEMIHSILRHRPRGGADLINARHRGGTALMKALRSPNENSEVLRALLQYKDLDLEQCDEFGRTAFHIAVDLVDLDALKLLVQRGGKVIVTRKECNKVGRSALMGLLRSTSPISVAERIEVFQFLTEQGASTEEMDAFGRNLLHYASVDDDLVPILDLLLEGGADVDSQDARGWTALHTACASGSRAAVNRLIRAGADISLEDRNCMIPATVAHVFHHEHIAQRIQEGTWTDQTENVPPHRRNVPVDSFPEADVPMNQSLYGTLHSGTALHAVINSCDDETRVLKVLHESNEDINALDHYGRTVLHVTIARRSRSFNYEEQDMIDKVIADILQRTDIDLNIADDRDERALELAMTCPEPLLNTSLALIEAGARLADTKLNSREVDYLFAHALAEARPSKNVIAALLAARPNIFLRIDGMTLSQTAVDRRLDQEILDMIAAEEDRVLSILKASNG